jgi:tRNA A-37 threonylcarbamoyl transferase component Bud32
VAHLGTVLELSGAAGTADYERYEITEEVGDREGVRLFKAHDRKLDQAVVVKTIERVGPSFHREVQALSRLHHPGLPRIVDCSAPTAPIAFLVAEQVAGVDLGVLIGTRALPEKIAAGVGAQVARALIALHAHGVVHGELQPCSVFIEHGGRVILLDAGVTKGIDAACMRTDAEPSGVMVALKGSTFTGQAGDLFALGALLYYASSKKLPFERSAEPPDLREVCGASDGMWQVVHQLLRKPADAEHAAAALRALAIDTRFGSIEEAIDELARGGGPPMAVTAIATAVLGSRKKRKGAPAAAAFDKDTTARLRLRTLFVRKRKRLMTVILASIALSAIAASWWIRSNAARFRRPVVTVELKTPEVPHATLRVAVTPWARVSIDGVERGRTPTFATIELPLGQHVVLVAHPKLGRREVTVSLTQPNAEQSVIIDLSAR